MHTICRNLLVILLVLPLASCNTFTAPISIPATIGSNHNYHLVADVVDPSGQALHDVKVQLSGSRSLWDPVHGTSIKLDRSIEASPSFVLKERASFLTLTLTKPGYDELIVRLYPGRIGFGHGLWGTYALKGPTKLTLHPAVVPRQGGLRYVSGEVISDEQILLPREQVVPDTENAVGQWAINLDSFSQYQEWWDYIVTEKGPLPANAFYTTMQSRDGREEITLHLTAADGGFIPFIPKATDYPLAQMRRAPAGGYQQSITIPAARIAEMLTPRADEKNDIVRHYQFFYFRANGKYGRLSMHRPYYWSSPGYQYFVEMEPTGSREIPYVPGW